MLCVIPVSVCLPTLCLSAGACAKLWVSAKALLLFTKVRWLQFSSLFIDLSFIDLNIMFVCVS